MHGSGHRRGPSHGPGLLSTKSWDLHFGAAIHEALAAHYSELRSTGLVLRTDLLLGVFRASWAKAEEGDIPLQADEDGECPAALADKGVSMLHAFHQHATHGGAPESVEAVEMGFTVDLHDTVSGEVLDEKLVGTIDLVIQERGRRVLVEHKTAARRYSKDQLDSDLQLAAYKGAARQIGMGEVGLRYQVLTKTKVPAIQIEDVTRDARAEDDFLRTVGGVLKAIDAGVSFPVRGWACRTCPWSGPCGAP